MYTQYQQYNTTAATQQQPMVWNGTAWVASAALDRGSSTHSTYDHNQQQYNNNNNHNNNNHSNNNVPPTGSSNTAVIPPNAVATFTQYYHDWQNYGRECEEYLRTLPPHGPERADAQRGVDWAAYYADESSRAAHYFYENPDAVAAPFELPPAPPSGKDGAGMNNHGGRNNVIGYNSSSSNNNNKYRFNGGGTGDAKPTFGRQNGTNGNYNSIEKQSDNQTPGGLTRYVKKCLEQCSTDEQQRKVQAEIEKVIARAIQDSSLHTKNWDVEPLLPVPGQTRGSHHEYSSRQQPQQQQQYQDRRENSSFNASGVRNNMDAGRYGPPRSAEKSRSRENQQGRPGRGSNNHHSPTRFDDRPRKDSRGGGNNGAYDDKLPQNDSYYGRSESSNSSINSNTANEFRSRKESPPGRSNSSATTNANYYGPTIASSKSSSNSSNLRHSPSEGSSPTSSQKRVVSPDEDFIAFKPKTKKRKGAAATPKAGFEKSEKVLANRANRFSGPGGIWDASNAASSVSGHDKYMGKRLIGGSQKKLDEEDFEKMTVKGTCLTLEKEYLRLTAPPRAELVRPQPILELHLDNIKQDYAAKKHDYLWFCSQLKAVRQDCTVQRIQNAFAVDVYETHARIALQEGDLNEYNQCQTQLKELYEHGEAVENQEEFVAYRLLYYVFLSTNEKYDGGSSDMFKIMLSLTPRQRTHHAIAHALEVREAFALGDYLQFFRLHDKAPHLGQCLTSLMIPTMRIRALRRIVKAYRPSLDIEVGSIQLGFKNDIGEATKYVISCGCIMDGLNIMTKDSQVHDPVIKTNSLI